MKLFFIVKDPRVATFSSVSTISVIGPCEDIFYFGVEVKTFGGDLSYDTIRELSIQVLNDVR